MIDKYDRSSGSVLAGGVLVAFKVRNYPCIVLSLLGVVFQFCLLNGYGDESQPATPILNASQKLFFSKAKKYYRSGDRERAFGYLLRLRKFIRL